jgi:hypothetical protein
MTMLADNVPVDSYRELENKLGHLEPALLEWCVQSGSLQRAAGSGLYAEKLLRKGRSCPTQTWAYWMRTSAPRLNPGDRRTRES